MSNLVITHVNSITSEGVSITLNKPEVLTAGGMKTKEWYVSWDAVGRALFGENYTDATTVKELESLRE